MQDSAGTRGLPLSVLKEVLLPYWHSILTITYFEFLVCFDFQSASRLVTHTPQVEFFPYACVHLTVCLQLTRKSQKGL